ncbi:MAG: LLM class F420-dependent oxidoreductase [Gammaproteobacteria bacterium]|jgi:probable F420-dependent oxidoreductase|nr:LLM class F420-dependent oxidoreductase [Gammaproteobacteria bacterium]|tara:strand:+ start:6171 stop:7037 length:867 start_codon:yes stop_codon:yes gene_type:complete
MKIGTFSTFMSPLCTPEMIGNFARDAENAGLDSLWMGEHVVLFDKTEIPYPGSKDGKLPVPEGGGMLDTVATIGYLAACSKTLRFGTGITLLPQRNPLYTAKEFATLDWLTGGRIDFGIGIGWCKEEVIACGYSFEDRGKRCDEILEMLKILWTEPTAQYHGKYYDLEPCHLDPKPIQKPHIPIIVGGHSKAGFRRAAKYGSGWYGFQMNVEQTAQVLVELDAALAKENRSRDDFELVITPPYRVSADMVKAYADLGVDQLIVHLGNQAAERISMRLAELETLVSAAA